MALVILWQKVLAPQFFEDMSRLRFNSSHLIRNFYTWVSVFALQLPNLFLKSLVYISFKTILIFVLVGALFWIGTHQTNKNKTHISDKWFFTISLASFFSSSLIFILSDESAVSWGYQARGLSSTWFCFAILIAIFTQLARAQSKSIRLFCLASIYLLTSFSILSFCIQRDKYIESWKLQLVILQDAIKLIQQRAIGPTASILADVPRYVPNNYNRELVYSQSWDFPAALVLYVQDHVRGGIVVDSRGKDRRRREQEEYRPRRAFLETSPLSFPCKQS